MGDILATNFCCWKESLDFLIHYPKEVSVTVNTIDEERKSKSYDQNAVWEFSRLFQGNESSISIKSPTSQTYNELMIQDDKNSTSNIYNRIIRRSKPGKYRDVEKALQIWLSNRIRVEEKHALTIEGNEIQEKALFYSQKFLHFDFKASRSWLYKFVKRHNRLITMYDKTAIKDRNLVTDSRNKFFVHHFKA